MTLLCYGDSNTYGFDPRSYFGGRYPAEVRWTHRLAQAPAGPSTTPGKTAGRSPGGRGSFKTSSAGQRTRTW